MEINYSVKVKNYKCFGNQEQGFEKILPINIIIGKNNSGKSSLIDLIEFICNPDGDIIGSNSGHSKCIIITEINDTFIEDVINLYDNSTSPNKNAWVNHLKKNVAENLDSPIIKFSINHHREIAFIDSSPSLGQYQGAFYRTLNSFFSNKTFIRINAERDIKPEHYDSKANLKSDGQYSTVLLWKYLAIKGYDQNLVKKNLLSALNEITKPDIEFTDITIKEESSENRQSARGEVFFEYPDGTWVALSKMGSGIKTILLVLLNLIIISEHERKERLVFGFEELENNLHPSLQRRLFKYISEYSEKNKCYFFITTHSNIPIDLFSDDENAQIIHVDKKDSTSFSKTVATSLDGRNILKDLDYRASDLLLSNGVVWVEGPSDALYIELFLTLYAKEQNNITKYSYCVQALSTAIWKYAGFSDFDWDKISSTTNNQIISLAKTNHNHIVVLDKDDNYEDRPPGEYHLFEHKTGQNKARLLFESLTYSDYGENRLINNWGDTDSNTLFFWVTPGTFETYLEYFSSNTGNYFRKYFDTEKQRGYFEKKRDGANYSKSKVELAAEIAKYAIENDLKFKDFAPKESELYNKVERLYNTIKYWNS